LCGTSKKAEGGRTADRALVASPRGTPPTLAILPISAKKNRGNTSLYGAAANLGKRVNLRAMEEDADLSGVVETRGGTKSCWGRRPVSDPSSTSQHKKNHSLLKARRKEELGNWQEKECLVGTLGALDKSSKGAPVRDAKGSANSQKIRKKTRVSSQTKKRGK